MNVYNSKCPKACNISTSSNPTPFQPGGGRAAPWKNDYDSSMNAISFGFVATAVLIAMFVIMAIFEHFFKPTSDQQGTHRLSMDMDKFPPQETVSSSYSMDFSVVMPGQKNPSYIAHHAPLPPCPREGVLWPSHQHSNPLPKPYKMLTNVVILEDTSWASPLWTLTTGLDFYI